MNSAKYPKLNAFLTEPKWKQVRGVVLFFVITISIHLVWKIWQHFLHYHPFHDLFFDGSNLMASWVYEQSVWIITHVLNIDLRLQEGQIMWLNNGCGIQINLSCSGLKPIIQFLLLMIIFPGPWKKKAWFIPLGVIVVYLTNILRVIGMAIAGSLAPEHLKFVHDNILRAMFYVVIFFLWWIWVEKVAMEREPEKPKKDTQSGSV
jgi:exosortase/archaeosortase family protein